MIRTIVAVICVVAFAFNAFGDTVLLKDGRTLEGSVIKFGNEYRIKTADGKTHIVRETDVKQIIKAGSAARPPAAADATGAGGRTVMPPPSNVPAGVSSNFMNVKRRADAVDAPIVAVTLWERFIESKPAPADLDAANAELEKWQQLQKDNAEKINGKWVGGAERKKLLKKVNELMADANKALVGNQTVQGIAKLEEALKLYPNSFEANFELGYFYLTKGAVGHTGRGNVQYLDKAIKSLEAASRILPTSAATWSNLAIGYNFRSRYVDSVQAAYKAAKIEDDKEIVQNLVNSIAHAPGGMQQNNPKIKPIMEDAVILAGKHGIGLRGGDWHYIRPRPPKEGDGSAQPDGVGQGKTGLVWSGSGFLITPDGYIITNRHVATGEPKGPIQKNLSFRVRLDDGTEKNAELVAVDDHADIALLKIKADSPMPYLKIAADNPKQASKALVLGYPATSMFGDEEMTLQISEGQVKSLHPGEDFEVWFDLNTTHGNSGGPIVDKNNRVVSILQGGRHVYNMVIVHGVGPLQIRRFLDRLGDKAPPAEYAEPGGGDFDGERVTEEARTSTVLVLVIRGAGSAADPPAGTDATDEPNDEPARDGAAAP